MRGLLGGVLLSVIVFIVLATVGGSPDDTEYDPPGQQAVVGADPPNGFIQWPDD